MWKWSFCFLSKCCFVVVEVEFGNPGFTRLSKRRAAVPKENEMITNAPTLDLFQVSGWLRSVKIIIFQTGVTV